MILPGAAAQVLSAILAFVLTMCILLTGVTAGLHLFTGTTKIHADVALNPQVRAAQLERISAKVEKAAEKHGFAVETVMNLITGEKLDDYNVGMIAWWQGLLQADPTFAAPAFDATALEAAIAADAGFLASHEERQVKSASRSAANDVAAAVQEAVLPIRANLISFAFSKVLGKIDLAKYMAFVPYLPWVMGLVCLLVCAAIMLLCARQPVRGAAFVGSGLCAGGLSMGCVMLAVFFMNVPAMVEAMSALLGMQVCLALNNLGLVLGAGAGLCVLAGLLMILRHQKKMASLRRRLATMEVQA